MPWAHSAINMTSIVAAYVERSKSVPYGYVSVGLLPLEAVKEPGFGTELLCLFNMHSEACFITTYHALKI